MNPLSQAKDIAECKAVLCVRSGKCRGHTGGTENKQRRQFVLFVHITFGHTYIRPRKRCIRSRFATGMSKADSCLVQFSITEDTLMFGGTLLVPSWLEMEQEPLEQHPVPGGWEEVLVPVARDEEEDAEEE